MRDKDTEIESEMHIMEICDLLLPPNSCHLNEIVRICKNNWNCPESRVVQIYNKAKDRIKKAAEADREFMLADAIERMEYLYKQSCNNKRYRDALEVVKEKNKLIGLYAPEKSEVTIKKDTSEMTDEELVKIINTDTK